MYDFLRGTVANLDAAGRLSLDVNGVGYLLRVSEQTRRRIPLDGSTVTIHVRLAVKEDDLALYGFGDAAERVAFDLLTSVQQVGPTVALAVLSQLGVDELRRILAARDAKSLRAVKGVGPKIAERIALELVDKAERIPAPAAPAAPASAAAALEQAHRGLVVLGYGQREAGEALQQVARPGLAAEEMLRAALAVLRGG